MPETARTARLRMHVTKHGGLTTSASTEEGFRRHLFVDGVVINRGQYVENSRFDWKLVRVEIYSPRPSEWLLNVARGHSVASACGIVQLSKGIEPGWYEFDDGRVPKPPIQSTVFVDHEAFAAIATQLAEADARKLEPNVELQFGGNALPAKSDSEWFGVPLEKLNVEEDRTYALQSIEFS